jgi:hypothetical protein
MHVLEIHVEWHDWRSMLQVGVISHLTRNLETSQ